MWVKVGDTVQVMTGDDAGEKAKVKAIDHGANKVTVEGVNRVYKHDLLLLLFLDGDHV